MNLYQLDLRAYSCPLPLLMTKKALATLPEPARLVIYLNRTSSPDDFELLCEQYGYQWQGCTYEAENVVLTIKK
ncbi:sulfurtransferase TusA family protein [Actinobacillus vicugnae]|uniref:sulfurtransferase TusA family protein n=1 Tax=Actinobacillus vicugnae TaxID=2573093 RepID=UPI00123F3986|nr:sulfurtransferase TusA family protein [Actinobacillus vicugnae]